MVVLDFGCGPGTFLSLLSPLCSKMIGIDIVPEFVEKSRDLIQTNGLENTDVYLSTGSIPFPNDHFDRIILVDTIHHLENIKSTLHEIHRVLKPDGKLLIFEPNKKNIVLWIMCLLDRNERGLLSLGTFDSYANVFKGLFIIDEKQWNGLLLGPSSRFSTTIADLLNSSLNGSLRWMLPKIFFTARKI
jgi:ubiquinone/menaquinone biosynthesis C-methylase UbiE